MAGDCPLLSPPPLAAIEALEDANDNSVDAWVVDLERHYQKIDACRASR